MYFTAWSARRQNKYRFPVGKARMEALGIVTFSIIMGTAAFFIIVEGASRFPVAAGGAATRERLRHSLLPAQRWRNPRVAAGIKQLASHATTELPHVWVVVGGTIGVVSAQHAAPLGLQHWGGSAQAVPPHLPKTPPTPLPRRL